MQLIDTHTHLYLQEFEPDRDDAIGRAVNSGIAKMLMPNVDAGTVGDMLQVAKKYPGICHPMNGLHPTSVKEDYLKQLETLEGYYSTDDFIAVGEIGIDLYWDKTFIWEQLIAFRKQIETAIEIKLPIVVHSRDSFTEVFSVLDEFKGTSLKGVLHAFTGGFEEAQKAISLGFKLGIGGIVTFKNSGLGNVIKETGIKDLVLETDSPYLAPAPYRGKRNESLYLCIINKRIAEITGETEMKVAETTFSNSAELFNLSDK